MVSPKDAVQEPALRLRGQAPRLFAPRLFAPRLFASRPLAPRHLLAAPAARGTPTPAPPHRCAPQNSRAAPGPHRDMPGRQRPRLRPTTSPPRTGAAPPAGAATRGGRGGCPAPPAAGVGAAARWATGWHQVHSGRRYGCRGARGPDPAPRPQGATAACARAGGRPAARGPSHGWRPGGPTGARATGARLRLVLRPGRRNHRPHDPRAAANSHCGAATGQIRAGAA